MRKIFCSLLFLLVRASCFAEIVTGSVTDVIGIGLSGATVNLYQGTTLVNTTQTLASGVYIISIPDTGLHQLEYSLYPYLTQVASINALTVDTEIYKNVSFPVTVNTSVVVNVYSLDYSSSITPVVGATVLIFQGGFIYGSGVTDSSGSITINGLSIGISTTIQIYNESNQIFRSQYTTRFLQDTFTFELSDDPATFSGTVSTTEGPAVGALVECYNASANTLASTIADSSGAYSMSKLPSGNFSIVATLSGYQQGIAFTNLPEGGTEIDVNITLPSYPATLVGTVYSSDTGLAIQGATLQLSQNQIVLSTIASDQFGAFLFANCPSGALVVNASITSYQGLSQGITLAEDGVGTLNFALYSDAFNISGTVESDGVPIDFATVTVTIGSSNQSYANTASDGTFTLNNLSLGSFGITATKDGYQSVTIPVEITSTENQSISFNLSQLPVSLSGLVTDVGNNPIANVLLQASVDGNLVGSATSDDSGNYIFYNLPAGEISVWTNYPTLQQVSYTSTFLAGDVSVQNFMLPPNPNTLTGVVIDAITNVPIPYAILFLHQSSIIPITGYCASVGQFSFSGLNQDIYTLSAKQTGYVSDTSEPVTFSGLNQAIKKVISLYPEDAPPRNIEGNIIPNNYGGGVIDFVHNISWEPSLSSKVISYNVYANGVFLANVPATATLEFNNHNQNKNVSTTYTVESINSNLSVSSSVEVVLR